MGRRETVCAQGLIEEAIQTSRRNELPKGRRSQEMKTTTKAVVKFGVTLLVMTVASAILWGHVTERLYDCADDCGFGFLTPGNWGHGFDGRTILSVSKIVHCRSMSEPDTMSQGWGIGTLWGLWGRSAAVTLGARTFLRWPRGRWRFKTTQDANQAAQAAAPNVADPGR